jgi:hypothetical protein
MTTPDIPERYPDPNWTPRQTELFENHGAPIYDRLATENGKAWYRRTYRPKKRKAASDTGGMMRRDHVKLGTPEDYVREMVSEKFSPMTNFHSSMMRRLSNYGNRKEQLDAAVADIVKAKLECRIDTNPKGALRLLLRSVEEAVLYGRLPDDTTTGDLSETLAIIIQAHEKHDELPHPAELLVDHDWVLPTRGES